MAPRGDVDKRKAVSTRSVSSKTDSTSKEAEGIPNATDGNGGDAPRAVLRIVNILSCIADSPTGATLSLLSREMEAPKSSLSNLLRGLVSAGYLSNYGGVYSLAGESYRLAASITRSSRLPEVSRAVIRGLWERTGETALVGVLTPDDRVMFVDQVVSSHTIAAQMQIGDARPLYASASGRAMLAMLPPERIKAYLASAKLDKLTKDTEIRRSTLKELLAQIRRQGYAFTDNESDLGLSGIAAPILSSSGLPVGSVVVAGPSERLRPKLQEWSVLVREAGEALSHFRGYSSRSL